MFIKNTAFKKIIKEAYKRSGLRVGNDGKGIYIGGGYWNIWVMEGMLPKEKLASIIELTGEIPEPGEAFRATDEGNQYEIMEGERFDAMKRAKNCKTQLKKTTLLYGGTREAQSRILQNKETKEITLIDDKFTQMIDVKELDYKNGEEGIIGPMAGGDQGVFWRSNLMAIQVMNRTTKAEELLKHIEKIDLPESV